MAGGDGDIDPDYAALFRPEPAGPPRTGEAPSASIEPVPASARDAAEDPVAPRPVTLPTSPPPDVTPSSDAPASAPEAVSPAEPPSAAPSEDAADTGRLFRSQGVADHPGAVLALSGDHFGRLRTLERDDEQPSEIVVRPSSRAARQEDGGEDGALPIGRREVRMASGRGISAGAVYLVIFGVTLVVAFINAWLGGGELGWPTGLALLASTVYCALRVRRDDDIVVVIAPPIAFFVAAITAGQLLRGAVGGGLLNRAQLVFFTLAYNWYWIIGTTVVALVIVVVRRRMR
jgi:hypothetical protein